MPVLPTRAQVHRGGRPDRAGLAVGVVAAARRVVRLRLFELHGHHFETFYVICSQAVPDHAVISLGSCRVPRVVRQGQRVPGPAEGHPVLCQTSFMTPARAFRPCWPPLGYSLTTPPMTRLRSIRAVISTGGRAGAE